MNRSLPDAELDGFVEALATRIASFDKWAIANTKRLVNAASLPPDVEMAAGWDACMASLARPAAQEPDQGLVRAGVSRARRRGRSPRVSTWAAWAAESVADASQGSRAVTELCSARTGRQSWICSPWRRTIADRVEAAGVARQNAGCGLRDRHPRERRPQSPHERSAGLRDRTRRAESLHVGAGGDANSRHPSACAAWASALPADVSGQILRNGRRGAAQQRWREAWRRRRKRRLVEQDVAMLEAD